MTKALLLSLLLIIASAFPAIAPAQDAYVDAVPMAADSLEGEAIALAPAALPDILAPSAPGEQIEENKYARIDYSNTRDGYVMVLYHAETSKRLKAQIKGPRTTYTYTLYPGQWAALPLTDGSGNYQIKVFRNASGNSYSSVLALKTSVELADEFAPFLRPNQYVDYSAESRAVALARELTASLEHPLDKVEAVYRYVVTNLTYDKEKARSVKSGYTPVLDDVLKARKGICFDYAALMTGMLRSLGVPCKMIFGYAGSAYHAWISVWSEDTGWIDGVIFFDGTAWQRLDPTFASSGNQSEEIMRFIGDGSNYKEKYFY